MATTAASANTKNESDKPLFVLEEVAIDPKELEELDHSLEEDMKYEEMPTDEISDSEEEDDFRAVIKTIREEKGQDSKVPVDKAKAKKPATTGSVAPGSASSVMSTATYKPIAVEDFIRNYFLQHNMNAALDAFQTEYYNMKEQGKFKEPSAPVPDLYLSHQQLEDEIRQLKFELDRTKSAAEKATSTWDKLRKERDYHRMHHRRVVQEKNKLITDIKRLKKHYAKYEPALLQIRKKHDAVYKEKMMMMLERDKLRVKVEALEHQLQLTDTAQRMKSTNGAASTQTQYSESKLKQTKSKPVESSWPEDDRENPYLHMEFAAFQAENLNLQKTFKGHTMAISSVCVHPTKPVVATTSDDTTWKIWSIPNGELIMSGDGHKDWIASCDFHPNASIIATASGDGTVRLWDYKDTSKLVVFTDHTQAVWSCAFHDTGDFLASASMDHSVKLWDIATGKCRQTYRGHVDSVNCAVFQPFSNLICTASGDKTLSLWDMRSGLCVQTFYGHGNAVSHAAFNLKGDTIASCDADGVVKLWDVRTISQRQHIATSAQRHGANEVQFDRSGSRVVVASDDANIKVYDTSDGNQVGELEGHEESVQGLTFDNSNTFLISCGSDCTFRIWSL